MNRPKITDEMKLAAARKIADKVDGDADTIAEAYHYPMDGYELARQLDRYHGWCDLAMCDVEELDCMDSLVRAELEEAEKEWAAQEKPEPPLPIGARIRQGVIDHLYEYSPARYAVKENGCTEQGRFLVVKFEDAIAV